MKKFFLVLIFLSLLMPLLAAEMICPLDGSPMKPKALKRYDSLKTMAVLDEGRLKPWETYGRNLLVRFSGRDYVAKDSAIVWLTRLLFAPDLTKKDAVFLINDPEIAQSLGLIPEKKRRYSFFQLNEKFEKLAELAQGAQTIDTKERSILENEIIRVYENIKLYAQLSQVFAFAFPHPDFTIDDAAIKRGLHLPEDQNEFSFIEIALQAQDLRELSRDLESKPEVRYSSQDRKTLLLLSNLFHWSFAYRELPFHMMPSKADREIWISPWNAATLELQDATIRTELILLRNMIVHYWGGDQLQFDLAAKRFKDSVHKVASKKERKTIRKFSLEIFYQEMKLFDVAKILYLLTFFVFLFSFLVQSKKIYRFAWVIIFCAFFAHVSALILRIIILARPPVSSLYETFVFVGFVTVVLGLLIERIHRQWLGIVISSLSGFVLLTIASKYSDEGDTLKMLIAVLNSNFWLGTHVLTITLGYGATCVAGIVGHVYLLQSVFEPHDKKLIERTYHILLGVLGLALTTTFIGTNLGGIWADQSWGRFWGWDPKENGALMIVLWCAILFHAKIARMIGPPGLAVGAVLGMIVVMWAWFGVNLLSIGLHSYGFTSGIALALGIYVAFELLFLVIVVPIIKRKNSL